MNNTDSGVISQFFKELLILIYPNKNVDLLLKKLEPVLIQTIIIHLASLQTKKQQENIVRILKDDQSNLNQIFDALLQTTNKHAFDTAVANGVVDVFNYYYKKVIPAVCPDKRRAVGQIAEKYQHQTYV